ncbi:MAG: pyrrolidone-carboxylate peptidase [Candidatus Azotimanducaceae bacterium]|jgi:pyrrolidone-carboxylate peptidase
MSKIFRPASLTLSLFFLACSAVDLMAVPSLKLSPLPLTVEELRFEKFQNAHPDVANRYSDIVGRTKDALSKATDFSVLNQTLSEAGQELWEAAKRTVAVEKDLDDRSLYWSRLALTAHLRSSYFALHLSSAQRIDLIETLENSSRGRLSIAYSAGTNSTGTNSTGTMKKILLTGFDPFLLDSNIDQSNPSGVVALNLDGKILTYQRTKAQIQTVIFPVRFEDFDAGELESLLEPLIRRNQIDMVVTVSMGRTDFDLEHFPGRRRSSSAPDNLNIHSGGTEKQPRIPLLEGSPIEGAEFVEFSLPYRAMRQVMLDAQQDASEEEGRFAYPYLINDNRTITTLDGTLKAETLAELKDATAVRGSGGGYLSNEISYRSVRLARKYHPHIPTGHIHTPRIESYDARKLAIISDQVTEMLRYSIIEL